MVQPLLPALKEPQYQNMNVAVKRKILTVIHSLETNSLVAESQGSMPLIPKPAAEQEAELVLFSP
jgi:hypothetical protein